MSNVKMVSLLDHELKALAALDNHAIAELEKRLLARIEWLEYAVKALMEKQGGDKAP
jgi:hypothetical protein